MRKMITRNILAGSAFLLTGVLNAQTTTPAPTDEFKPSGNVWGYVFGDFAMKTNNDTLGRGAGNVQYRGTNSLNSNNVSSASNPVPANSQSNAFQIRRAYLGYDYQLAKNFSASVVLANEQTLLPNNQNTVYLKYAFLKWSNIWKGTDITIGQFQTCSFATGFGTEPLWGYRASERTIMDLHNNDGSTDLGVSLQGKLWEQKNVTEEDKKPNLVGYILQVGNGASATPAAAPYKKTRVNLYTALMNQKLVIGVYGDYLVQQLSPYHTSNMTMKIYASFKTEAFHIGFEAYQQTNQNSDIYKVYDPKINTTDANNDTVSGVQMGVSVWASAKIIKNKLNVFARYDSYNPDTKWNTMNVYSKAYSGITGSNLQAATFYKQQFLNVGLDWTPDKRVHIMPNVWYNSYNANMSTASADGLGKLYGTRVVKDYDLVYRVTFYYLFNPAKKVSNNGFY
ncbi:MAG: hypothetical protein ACHQRM_04795 [Bacteroidia bacterium]